MAASPRAPACDVSCPVQRTAQVLDGKWTILVLRDLLSGTKRYSELQRSLVGISPRLLASRLKALEAQGLVRRTAYATVPPTTEYALTLQGAGVLPVVQAMANFGAVLLAQDRDGALPRVDRAPRPASGVTRVRSGRRAS